VIFNLATGLLAFALLPWFLRGLLWAQDTLGLEPGAYSLVTFHTTFIALGAVLFLPWIKPFCRGIERLLPDRGPPLTRHLDKALLATPAVALEATRRALCDTAVLGLRHIRGILRGEFDPAAETRLEESRQAIAFLESYLAQIPAQTTNEPLSARRLEQMHAIDHLIRLGERMRLSPGARRRLPESHFAAARELADAILETGLAIAGGAPADPTRLEALSTQLAALRREQRALILKNTADGQHSPTEALEELDAMRWLDQVGYHTWRIGVYLAAKAG
jgi:phosphate:Na+ symporter